MLIIASQTELKYKDLSPTLLKFDSDAAECKLDLQVTLKQTDF
jgi:hypothetical protein